MEIRVRDLARTPLGSASFVDLRLPEGELNAIGQRVLTDTLAIHVRPQVLRTRAAPGDIQTAAGRLRLNGLAHVGVLQVQRAGVLYVVYLNPADEELLERVKRIRAQGYFWICMYDVLATFGMNNIAPIDSSFLECVLEVREQAHGVSREMFELSTDGVDWVMRHPENALPLLPGFRRLAGTLCTARDSCAPVNSTRTQGESRQKAAGFRSILNDRDLATNKD